MFEYLIGLVLVKLALPIVTIFYRRFSISAKLWQVLRAQQSENSDRPFWSLWLRHSAFYYVILTLGSIRATLSGLATNFGFESTYARLDPLYRLVIGVHQYRGELYLTTVPVMLFAIALHHWLYYRIDSRLWQLYRVTEYQLRYRFQSLTRQLLPDSQHESGFGLGSSLAFSWRLVDTLWHGIDRQTSTPVRFRNHQQHETAATSQAAVTNRTWCRLILVNLLLQSCYILAHVVAVVFMVLICTYVVVLLARQPQWTLANWLLTMLDAGIGVVHASQFMLLAILYCESLTLGACFGMARLRSHSTVSALASTSKKRQQSPDKTSKPESTRSYLLAILLGIPPIG